MFRFAIVMVAAALLLLISGALVTGDAAATPPVEPGLIETVHPWIGAVAGVLTLIFAIRSSGPARMLAWSLVALIVIEGGLGSRGAMAVSPAWMGTLHAFLAHIFFTGIVAAVTCTSPGWEKGPELVADCGWPSFRTFAVITPALLLIQVFLGAGLRHKATGALSHIGFAMVIALWILFQGICVIQQFPKHSMLRPAANWFLAATFTQVFLGIGAFTVRTMELTGPWVAAVTSAHVTMGAITLAMSVVLSMHSRRHCRKGLTVAPA